MKDLFSGATPLEISDSERFYISIATFFMLLGLVSLTLVRLSSFTLPLNFGVTLFISVLLFRYLKISPTLQKSVSSTDFCIFDCFIIGTLIILVIALYGCFSTSFVDGGRDPGLYLIFSHQIAKTGELNLDLSWLKELYANFGGVIECGYPGIYSAFELGLSGDPGRLIPQFMHLFPAYGGVAGALFGLDGIIHINTVILFFAFYSCYQVASEFMSKWGAFLVIMMFAFNPSMLWVGRSTFSEPLQIFILFFSFYLILKSLKIKSTRLALLGGIVLGCAVLNRISALIGGVLIFGLSLYAGLWRLELRRMLLLSLIGYLFSSSVALLDGYLNSYPYMELLWRLGSLKKLLLLHLFVVVGALIVLKIRVSRLCRRNLRRGFFFLLPAILLLVSGWIIYRGVNFLGPEFGFALRSASELVWYITWPVMILALLSIALAWYQHEWLYLFSVAFMMLLTLFIYTWKPSISPDHYWASRRWLSFCIPLLILGSVKSLTAFALYFKQSKSRLKSLVLLLFMAFSLGSYAVACARLTSPFFHTSLLASYPKHYAEIAERLRPLKGELPFFSLDPPSASVLTYIYDVPTVLLSKKGYQELVAGRLFGVPSLGLTSFSRISVEDPDLFRFCDSYTDKSVAAPPSRLVDYCRNLTPGIIVDTVTKGRSENHCAAFYPTQVGIKSVMQGTVTSTGKAGALQYGPYLATAPGRYQVVWDLVISARLPAADRFAVVDVVIERGTQVLVRSEVNRKNLQLGGDGRTASIVLEFELEQPVIDLEYRFWIENGVYLKLNSINLKYLGI